ncbi:phage tail tube protein [Sneathiella chinensis]|uniref:AsmA-like C-terminal domain-containing protein n=1 Tax=Sneathiella chinensis TaxID=349750 RepID=A0ABQ5U864_9PROT|nr:phage tail tube protein [Sneathiella chinensis]GLQ07512.1 hypothetical protein GCM10007924_27330 [Sneathiella chinensis]
MIFASQSRHLLGIVAEDVAGTTPPSPEITPLRHTGCDLTLSKETVESDEIRSDRQIGHFNHGRKSVAGDIDFELSFGSFDSLLEGAFCASWSGNVLKTGSEEKSFTIERGFPDIQQYQRFTGCVVNQMALTVQPDSLVSGRFGIMGRDMMPAAAALDPSPGPTLSAAPMDGFGGSVSEGGAPLAEVAGLDLKIENGFEAAHVLGSDVAGAMTYGRSRVSGEMTVWFENRALIDKFLGKVPSRLALTLNGEGGGYEILLPNILYSGADIPVKGGRGAILTLPFIALHDGVLGSNIQITRIPA